MAATTGPALKTSTSQVTSTSTLSGQGLAPIVRGRYSTDDVSVVTPTWIELAASQLRNFGVSRGRDSEQSQFDAGTASVTLDNRDRTFDPVLHATIRPLNRWWLFEEFSGEVQDLFKGYAESYGNQWPGGGWSDAECIVTLADEFKVAALDNLPTTNPPRGSYADLVLFDQPSGYWAMKDDPASFQQTSVQDSPPVIIDASATPSSTSAVDVIPGGWRRGWPRPHAWDL
jgi:hypothetical protein